MGLSAGLCWTTPSIAAAASGDPTPNSTRPMALVLNPGKGAVLSSAVSPVAVPFLVQVQVASPTGGGAIAAMALTTDGTAPSCAGTGLGSFALNPKYALGSSGAVYERQLSLAPGSYTLRVCARNTAGAVEAPAVPFSVTSHPDRGDGNLLVRDNSTQLCADCHKLESHSSASASNKYGSWAIGCRDCHVPHGTRNIYLVGEQITPPDYAGATGPKAVRFATTAGDSGIAGGTAPASSSYVNADHTGPCQICHTQTRNPSTGAPRFRFGNNADTHFTAAAGTQRCGSCHSHTKGFAASCTGCHGDAARAGDLGVAPPKDTCNNVTGGRVGAHQAHLTGRGVVSSGVGCAQCHVNPPSGAHPTYGMCDSSAARHAIMTWGPVATAVLAGDSTPGAPTWSASTQNCTNYCHGDFKNGNRTNVVGWTGAQLSGCTSCHGSPPGGTHPANSSCGTCHTGYTASSVVLATHVNGTVEVVPMTCSGCHGDAGRTAVASASAIDPLGTAKIVLSAPPKDSSGNTPGVAGAHQAHVNQGAASPPLSNAFTCTVCHGAAVSSYTVSHANGTTQISFTGVAVTGGATPGYASPTCSSTYCHGKFQSGNSQAPGWFTGGKLGCSTCHNSPPVLPHPGAADCGRCHTGYTQTAVVTASHVNGLVERVVTSGCAQCHGDANRTFASVPGADPVNGIAAPPYDTQGRSSNTASRKVGAHLQHVGNDGFASSRAVACTECHAVALPTGTDTTHADGSTSIGFGLATLAKTGGAAPAWNSVQASCSLVYCHGNFTGGLAAAPGWTGPASGNCGTCHALPPAIATHHPQNAACGACHTGYSATATNASVHVDGTVQKPANGCTACHGVLAGQGGAAVANTSLTVAPGYNTTTAVDSAGGTLTSRRGVGAHYRHLTPALRLDPIACTDCHGALPGPGDTLHATGAVDIAWGTLARTNGSTGGIVQAATVTCSSLWCHGGNAAIAGATATTVTWNPPQSLGCTSCHGNPPPTSSGHVSRTDCNTCHGDGYTNTAVSGTALATHVDGSVNTRGLTCSTCHGTSGRPDATGWAAGAIDPQQTAAPPVDTAGNSLNTAAGVGAHQTHVNNALSTASLGSPIHCDVCHGTAVNSYAVTHPNGQTAISFTGLAAAAGATYGTTSHACSNVYCHGNFTYGAVTGTLANAPVWTSTFSGCVGCHTLPPAGHAATGTTAASCAVCHAETVNTDGTIRYVGGATKHVNGQADGGISKGNTSCLNCHKLGMVVTSLGSLSTEGATTLQQTYHHVMKEDLALTSGTSRTIYPTSATPATTGTGAAGKSCVQCHGDHNVFDPSVNLATGVDPGDNLRVNIAAAPPVYATGTTFSLAPGTTITNTDRVAAAPGGICLSCHASAQVKDTVNQKSDGTAGTYVIDAAGYSGSRHRYAVAGAISRGPGPFTVDCTKCHSSTSTQYQNGTWKFALHTSVDRRLLNPMGITAPADPLEEKFCFRCHSASTDASPGGGPAKTATALDYFGATAMYGGATDLYRTMLEGTPVDTTAQTMYVRQQLEGSPMTTQSADGAVAMAPLGLDERYGYQATAGGTTAAASLPATTGNYFVAAFSTPPSAAVVSLPTTANGWVTRLWAKTTATTATLRVYAYVWTAAGTKAAIFGPTSFASALTTARAPYTLSSTGAAATLGVGDRVVLEVWAVNGTATAKTINVYFDGNTTTTDDSSLRMPAVTGTGYSWSTGHQLGTWTGVHRPNPAEEHLQRIAANKHSGCTDCHNPHEARSEVIGSGLATSTGTSSTLNASPGTWGSASLVGYTIWIRSAAGTGTGAAQHRGMITANTTTQVTFTPGMGTTASTPVAYNTAINDPYRITLEGRSGTITTVGTNLFTDTTKSPVWPTSAYVGGLVRIIQGTGAGSVGLITANTGTQINVASWSGTVPAAGSLYSINPPTMAQAGASGVDATGFSTNTWGGVVAYTPAAGSTTQLPEAKTQWQTCFKCHSSANTALATWDSNWTDLGNELNPNNAAYHPIIQALPSTDPGANGSNRLAAGQLINGWTPGSVMTCTDCHNADAASPAAQGPHGSAVQYMLAGINRAWPFTVAGAISGTLYQVGTTTSPGNEFNIGTANGLFCRNCHPAMTATGSNYIHRQYSQDTAHNGRFQCVDCHIRVPHGGKVSRLIRTTNTPARYVLPGTTPTFTSFSKNAAKDSYATSNWQPTATIDGQACGGTGAEHSQAAASEAW